MYTQEVPPSKTSCKVTIYDDDGILENMKLEVLESVSISTGIPLILCASSFYKIINS